jgi:[pyruvate, water dikinase]-phosphate phosphotransferase / [pyruvate, water dikinase] kinase
MTQQRTVFIVSDRTGITAETLSHSLLTQFDTVKFNVVTVPFLNTPDKARALVERIADAGRKPA